MEQVAAFTAVTLQRAFHNSFIEWAKGDSGTAQYTVSSVIFVAQTCCVLIGWWLAYQGGGKRALERCWDPRILKKFAHIGMIYAIGDIFEMESVNYIDSSTYTVLSQSKLIITALLMWGVDGVKQSIMQWFILFTTSAGMLEYVLVGKAKGGAMTFSSFGIMLALVKVVVSCWVAVLNQKALKKDSNIFPVQFSALKVSWAMTSLVYMIIKDGFMGDWNLFGEWSGRTVVLVFAGFILKTLFNQYLLKVLDAIWKNISEAIGAILVYFAKVVFLGGAFDASVFNAAFTVILACIAYVLSKSEKSGKRKLNAVGDELDPTKYPDLETDIAKNGPAKVQSFEVDDANAEESGIGPLVRGRRIATSALGHCRKRWHLMLYGSVLCGLIPVIALQKYASLNATAGNLGLFYTMVVVLCPYEMATRRARLMMLLLYPLAWMLCDPLINKLISERTLNVVKM